MGTWIVNGTVVDGTGAPASPGNLRLEGDRIAEAGPGAVPPAETADRVIDAAGLAVAPGFMDLHSHSDVALMVDPVVQSKLNQGITLELVGQDGMSLAPLTDEVAGPWRQHLAGLAGSYDVDWTWRTFDEYLDRFGAIAPNVAALVGHGTLRLCVAGMEKRPLTREELDRAKGLLRDSLDAGAFGLSGGLVYQPGSYGTFEEMVELNRIVAEAGKLWMVHIRYEGDRILEGLDEMFRLAEETGVALHISHFKALGRRNWGRGPEIVAAVDAARARGLDVTADQYPYTAGSTMLAAIMPPWVHAQGPAQLLAWLQDPVTLGRIEAEIASGLPDWEGFVAGTGWENVRISEIGGGRYPAIIGLSLTEIGESWGCTPFEAATRLLVEAELAVSMVLHAMHDDDVAAILRAPWRTGGTDALLGGEPHPRAYGSYPRILGHYVRERGVIGLEEAVRQMTGAAAKRLRITDRGRIAPGMKADLVLFDPKEIADRATFERPRQYPEGIDWVFVNGQPVIEGTTVTGNLPGEVLRQR